MLEAIQTANLDVWQGHEILGNVNNKLVHESRSNVESIHGVVHVIPKKKKTVQLQTIIQIKIPSTQMIKSETSILKLH